MDVQVHLSASGSYYLFTSLVGLGTAIIAWLLRLKRTRIATMVGKRFAADHPGETVSALKRFRKGRNWIAKVEYGGPEHRSCLYEISQVDEVVSSYSGPDPETSA